MSLKNLINSPQDPPQKQELHQWQVVGCSTRPMGNYLKALGLLRIVRDLASDARGFWQGDSFYIQSSTKPEEIIERISTSYKPSAICTPWNGSSGFYKKMPRYMTAILEGKCERFLRLKNAYEISQKLTSREGLRKDLKNKTKKYKFISQVRSAAIDESWNYWLNIVSVTKITIDKNGKKKQEYAYPGLTGGTGGIIGNKDMGVCFVEALDCLWNLKTGETKSKAQSLIESSLLGRYIEKSLMKKALLTQFYPVNDFLLDISGAERYGEYPSFIILGEVK